MAVTTNATFAHKLSWSRIDTETSVRITDDGNVGYSYTYANGTGLGDVNKLWHGTGYLASGENSIYDLTNLTASYFDNDVQLSFDSGTINTFIFENTSVSGAITEYVVIGPSGSAGFTEPFGGVSNSLIPVYQSGTFSVMNSISGFAVNTGVKNFMVANSGNDAASYEIAIIGQV